MCHTAVAQLDTSYPALHPVMAIAQSPLPRLNQIVELVDYLYLYEITAYGALSETNSHSFVPFQTRVIVRLVPNIQSVILI